jgi:tetratricopeptide (TPR) repeat protein
MAALCVVLGFAAAPAAAVPSDADVAVLSADFERHPDDPAVARALARAQLERGEVDAAIGELRDLGARLPQHRAALAQLLGRALYLKGDWVEARAELEQAIAYRPQDALAHFYLGLVLIQSGDADGAARELRVAEEIEPGLLPGARPRELAPFLHGHYTFMGGAGLEYDTNPTIEGEESLSGSKTGNDVRLVYNAAIATQLLRTERSALWASYRFDDSRHDHFDQLDLQSHGFALGGVHAFDDRVFARLDGSAGLFRLDNADYLDTWTLLPALGVGLGRFGVLQLRGGAERRDFADEPTAPSLERDGWRYSTGLSHTLPIECWGARLTTELEYARTLTNASTDANGFGSAFDSNWISADAAFAVPIVFGILLETNLLVGYERFDNENAVQFSADYNATTNPNPRRIRRDDIVVDTSLSLVLPVTRLLDLELRVRETRHASNAAVYDWDRQIVGTYLRFHFDH